MERSMCVDPGLSIIYDLLFITLSGHLNSTPFLKWRKGGSESDLCKEYSK